MRVREWLGRTGVKTLFIEPGSPWENGYMESFNGKLRDELLDREIFETLLEAKVLTKRWRQGYNTVKPHGSLGCRPPTPGSRMFTQASFRTHSTTAKTNKSRDETTTEKVDSFPGGRSLLTQQAITTSAIEGVREAAKADAILDAFTAHVQKFVKVHQFDIGSALGRQRRRAADHRGRICRSGRLRGSNDPVFSQRTNS